MSDRSQRGQLATVIVGGFLGYLTGGGATAVIQGLALGFSVGAFLFPPEIEQDAFQADFINVTEGDPIPVVFGIGVVTPKITYVDFDRANLVGKKEELRHVFCPMQVALCMSDKVESIASNAQGGVRLSTSFNHSTTAFDPPEYPKVVLMDEKNEPLPWVTYYARPYSDKFQERLAKQQTLDKLREWLARNNRVVDSSKEVTLEQIIRSFPQISWGGEAKDWSAIFNADTWIPYSVNSEEAAPEPPAEDIWPVDVSPLKGVLNLASPVWYHGKGVASVQNFRARVEYVYPEDVGQVYLLCLTHPVWGMGIDSSLINTRSFELNAKAVHFDAEGLTFNGVLTGARSGKSVLEYLNSHVGAIVRRDHIGRFELLPLRSIADNHYTSDEYQTWLDAGADEEADFTYIPGFPVLFDVFEDEDPGVQISLSNQGWSETKNEVIASFPNRDAEYKETPIVVRNTANRRVIGHRAELSANYPLFSNQAQVVRRSQQVLLEKSRPGAVAEVNLPRHFHRVRVGDGLRLFSSDHGLAGVIFRVMDLEHGGLGEIPIRASCVLDVASLYSEKYAEFSVTVPPQDDAEPSFPDSPDDLAATLAFTNHWLHNFADPDVLWPGSTTAVGQYNLLADPDDLTTGNWSGGAFVGDKVLGPDGALSATALLGQNGSFQAQTIPSASITPDAPHTAAVIVENVNSDETRLRLRNASSTTVSSVRVLWGAGSVSITESTGDSVDARGYALPDGSYYLEATVLDTGEDLVVEIIPEVDASFGTVNIWRPLCVLGRSALKRMQTVTLAALNADRHIAWRYAIEEGPLTPYIAPLLPAQTKGTSLSSSFAQQFSLVAPINGDEHRYVLPPTDDSGFRVYLVGEGDVATDSIKNAPWFGERTEAESESGDYGLVIVGRPGRFGSDDVEPIVEILRFRNSGFASEQRLNFLLSENQDFLTWEKDANARTPLVSAFASPVPEIPFYHFLGTTGSATGPGEYRKAATPFTAGLRQSASILIRAGGGSATHIEVVLHDITNDVEHGAVFEIATGSATSIGNGSGSSELFLSENYAVLQIQYKTGDGGVTVGGEERELIVRIGSTSAGGPYTNLDYLVAAPILNDDATERSVWTERDVPIEDEYIYLEEVQRSCNRERAYHWPAGSECWIADLSAPGWDSTIPYSIWAHRSVARDRADAEGAQGHRRARIYAQSVTYLGDGNPETEIAQDESEGLTRTFGASSSNFFPSEAYLENSYGPGPPALAARFGAMDGPLWYDVHVDQADNLLAGTSFTDWGIIVGSGTATGDVSPGAFSPDLIAGVLEDTSPTIRSGWEKTIPAASLTSGADLRVSVLCRPEDLLDLQSSSTLLLNQPSTGTTEIQWSWASRTESFVSGDADAEELGYDRWVKLTARLAGINDTENVRVRLYADDTATEQHSLIVDAEYAIEGSEDALPKTDDWIIQFQPMDLDGGIGQSCNNSAQNNCKSSWPVYDQDLPWGTLTTLNPNVAGSYRATMTASMPGFEEDSLSSVVVTVGRGDPWPSFILQNPNDVVDDPSTGPHYGTSQLQFSIAKLDGKDGGAVVDGPASNALKQGSWPQYLE